ncbi:MAG TPA: hypothetical protein VGM25_00240 [Caulobacteraceae bacterium]|jgi:hypothetical protein
MKAVLVMLAALALVTAGGSPGEARTSGIHKPRIHSPRPHKPRTPKSAYRTVRVRRADGRVMTGYRDSLGTHLRHADGRTVNCQRQVGAADVNVTCH